MSKWKVPRGERLDRILEELPKLTDDEVEVLFDAVRERRQIPVAWVEGKPVGR
jgi:hypothetical protein